MRRDVVITLNCIAPELQDAARVAEDEQGLVKRLQSGDQAAVEELFRAYVPRLYRLIYYATGSDISDAEDILQETMLAALRALHRFRGNSGLYTWLCAIARHKIQDHFRRQQRRRAHTSLDALDDLVEVGDTLPPLDGQVVQQHALQQALQGLPVDYRTVLVGKYIEGFSVQELARIMGRSEKSVESLLSRARGALRTRLTG